MVNFMNRVFSPILLYDGVQVKAQWVHTAYRTGMEK